MKPKVVIIGGGVAGLSAGIYSAMNGFDTEIIEMHSVAGGQCTAWDCKNYRFDYCLHWLVGTSPGAFHDIWKETGVLNSTTEVINHEIHSQIIDKEGNTFNIYADIDRWERYLLDLPPELHGPADYLRILPKMFPLLMLVHKYGRSMALPGRGPATCRPIGQVGGATDL